MSSSSNKRTEVLEFNSKDELVNVFYEKARSFPPIGVLFTNLNFEEEIGVNDFDSETIMFVASIPELPSSVAILAKIGEADKWLSDIASTNDGKFVEFVDLMADNFGRMLFTSVLNILSAIAPNIKLGDSIDFSLIQHVQDALRNYAIGGDEESQIEFVSFRSDLLTIFGIAKASMSMSFRDADIVSLKSMDIFREENSDEFEDLFGQLFAEAVETTIRLIVENKEFIFGELSTEDGGSNAN